MSGRLIGLLLLALIELFASLGFRNHAMAEGARAETHYRQAMEAHERTLEYQGLMDAYCSASATRERLEWAEQQKLEEVIPRIPQL